MQQSINIKILTDKIVFTVFLLIFSRIGVFIPIPGLDHASLYYHASNNGLVNFLNIISGGNFSTLGIFTLGIGPYINSSIMVQSLTKILPSLQKLKEEGGNGYKRINQITRYLSIFLAILQSIGILIWIKPYVFDWNIGFILETIICLTTGSIIIMWLGEIITDKGIGNGQSLLIFQNIIASMSNNLYSSLVLNYTRTSFKTIIGLGASFVFMSLITIFIQESKRKIILVSTRQLGKEITINNYLPLKFNYLGVMPLIISSTIMNFLNYKILYLFYYSKIISLFLYYILIILFSYVQSFIILDPQEISKNLNKMGTSIPLVRPGEATAEYLRSILNRLTFLGANYLCIIACIPSIISTLMNIPNVNGIGVTTLFILINVTIDTVKEIKTYKISQKYETIS
uniref:Protein translocase subunit SecY n=1 Tax=Compsopogon caeruleus TaxID=31354 RepID=A0A1Z1XB52_9RHOD|nr:preprotein translocase subunit SecY [Compsopogon caeruleus]ARX96093.1 preprotein translocase subunit SecY [Compsopogon caeruleus]